MLRKESHNETNSTKSQELSLFSPFLSHQSFQLAVINLVNEFVARPSCYYKTICRWVPWHAGTVIDRENTEWPHALSFIDLFSLRRWGAQRPHSLWRLREAASPSLDKRSPKTTNYLRAGDWAQMKLICCCSGEAEVCCDGVVSGGPRELQQWSKTKCWCKRIHGQPCFTIRPDWLCTVQLLTGPDYKCYSGGKTNIKQNKQTNEKKATVWEKQKTCANIVLMLYLWCE